MGFKPRKIKKVHRLEVIVGVAGPCVGLNSIRIAGPKPWGGGTVIATFKVDHEDLLLGISNRKKETDCEQKTVPGRRD